MVNEKENKQICLRYHLENNEPVDLMEFTKGLQALHDEYINYRNKKGEITTKPKLSIYKVEEGSIIFDLIDALPPAEITCTYLGYANTIIEFAGYLGKAIIGLAKGGNIPTEANNRKSLDNISKFIQPLASNPASKMEIQVIENNSGDIRVYNNCSFGIDSTEGNAVQNRAHVASERLEQESKTEEAKLGVLLRPIQFSSAEKSESNKGIIEAFDTKVRKLIFADKSIKQEFAEGEENIFTHIYYVDVTAMYNEGKIVAYRIDKVHDKFLPED